MKRTIFSPCELRAWLDTHEAELKAAVLAQPILARNSGQCSSATTDELGPTDYRSVGLNFITDYLDKAGVGFDQDDYDSQRVIAVAGSWVTRWRLGYE
jgi:hypothetical protein